MSTETTPGPAAPTAPDRVAALETAYQQALAACDRASTAYDEAGMAERTTRALAQLFGRTSTTDPACQAAITATDAAWRAYTAAAAAQSDAFWAWEFARRRAVRA